MVGNNRIFLSLFIGCLFSLTVLQVSLKISQTGQPNQILGVATGNDLSCSNLYQFYQQHCSTIPIATPQPLRQPDLIISSITLEKIIPPQSDCPQYRYTVLVKNIGSGNAPKSMLKTNLSPSQPQALDSCTRSRPYEGSLSPIPNNYQVHTDFLPPGAIEKYSDSFNPSTSGTITISVAADYSNNLIESNESNNLLSQSFNVDALWTAPLAPTLTPTAYCTNESARCLNSTTYQVCANGQWQAYSCPENKHCDGNGHCLE